MGGGFVHNAVRFPLRRSGRRGLSGSLLQDRTLRAGRLIFGFCGWSCPPVGSGLRSEGCFSRSTRRCGLGLRAILSFGGAELWCVTHFTAVGTLHLTIIRFLADRCHRKWLLWNRRGDSSDRASFTSALLQFISNGLLKVPYHGVLLKFQRQCRRTLLAFQEKHIQK